MYRLKGNLIPNEKLSKSKKICFYFRLRGTNNESWQSPVFIVGCKIEFTNYDK